MEPMNKDGSPAVMATTLAVLMTGVFTASAEVRGRSIRGRTCVARTG